MEHVNCWVSEISRQVPQEISEDSERQALEEAVRRYEKAAGLLRASAVSREMLSCGCQIVNVGYWLFFQTPYSEPSSKLKNNQASFPMGNLCVCGNSWVLGDQFL